MLLRWLISKQLVSFFLCFDAYMNYYRIKYLKGNMIQTVTAVIDANLYWHKANYSYNGEFLIGFWNQIMKLRSNRVRPIYISDGKPCPEKIRNAIKIRSNRKKHDLEKINAIEEKIDLIVSTSKATDEKHSSDSLCSLANPGSAWAGQYARSSVSEVRQGLKEGDEIKRLQIQHNKLSRNVSKMTKHNEGMMADFLKLMGVELYKAQGETDALLGKLKSQLTITDDTDMIVLGCPLVLKFHRGKIMEFDTAKIYRALGLTHTSFIDMCLMFGNDYMKFKVKLSPDTIYDAIKKYGTIESIVDASAFGRYTEKIKRVLHEYQRVRKIISDGVTNEPIPKFVDTSTAYLEENKIMKMFSQHLFNPLKIQEIIRIRASIIYINHIIKLKKDRMNRISKNKVITTHIKRNLIPGTNSGNDNKMMDVKICRTPQFIRHTKDLKNTISQII